MRNLLFCTIFIVAVQAHAEQTVIACGHPNYPPFMWQEEKKIIGAGPEIAAQILKQWGLKLDSRYVGNWKRCQKEIQLGRVDMFVAAYKTKERESYADYLPAHLAQDPTAAFVWSTRTFRYRSWDDLIGKRIGTNLGGSMGEAFDAFIKNNFKEHQVSTRLQNFKKLEANRIDFHPTGLYAGLLDAAKHGYEGRIIPLEPHINTEYLFFAFSKKSPFKQLIPKMNTALNRMKREGTVQPVIQRFLKQYSKTSESTE